jgi:hypothetical protein
MVENDQIWYRKWPKMKNDVFFGFCEEFHTDNIKLRKMVRMTKYDPKCPEMV